MSAKDYVKRYGKLRNTFAVSVDDQFKEIELKARSVKFDFAEWARRKLYDALPEVEEFISTAK